MASFVPLNREPVTKIVIRQIKQAMLEGKLRRGDRLPSELELTNQLQVGRTSVREALKMLEALGVVESRVGQGTYIPQTPKAPDVDPLLFLLLLEDGTRSDLVEFRYMFEVAFVKLAQPKLTAEQVAALEQAITDLKGAAEQGKVCADHDLAFHKIILEATGNPFVVQVGNTIMELMRSSIDQAVRTVPDRAVSDHERILEALKNGKSEDVEAAVLESYRIWSNIV